MENVRLEFEEFEILSQKKSWRAYFFIATDHPTDPDKMVVTSLPSTADNIIRLKSNANNLVRFEPDAEDNGADGLFVLERSLPATRRITVRAFLMHSRKPIRDLGEILQDMEGELGADAFGIVDNMFGGTSPWLVILKKAAPLIGGILKKVKDKDFGFISLDEEFGPEFENQVELDRENTFSTGDARLAWSWSIKGEIS